MKKTKDKKLENKLMVEYIRYRQELFDSQLLDEIMSKKRASAIQESFHNRVKGVALPEYFDKKGDFRYKA